MKTRVYLDVLFCVNLFVDYFLLLGVRRFFHLSTGRLRLIAGAAAGATGACALFFLRAGRIVSAFCGLILAAATVAAAFLPLSAAKLLKIFAAFYLMNFAYAGVMLAFYTFLMPGALRIRNGVVYFSLSPLALFGLTVGAYGVISLITRLTGRRMTKARYCELKVEYGGREYRFRGKIDTGCALREPFSGFPVAVLGKGSAALRASVPETSLRLIPYADLSGEGVLEGFCPPQVRFCLGGREQIRRDCCLAFFPGEFGEGDFEALVSPELIEERME